MRPEGTSGAIRFIQPITTGLRGSRGKVDPRKRENPWFSKGFEGLLVSEDRCSIQLSTGAYQATTDLRE
jgi:hypothetical protein